MKIDLSGLVCRGERVAVGLSGGMDSVALFNALIEREEELGIEVLAVNIDHGIRGERSGADSEFVRKMCDNARKRALFYKVDAPARAKEKGATLEQAARELRYECFFDAIEKGFCDRVATAHHAGDNAETVLMNLFRGSGVAGLKGIARVSFGGRIIRPMLATEKSEIVAYIAQKRLPYVDDETNSDESYSRNFIRNSVLPTVLGRYPGAVTSICGLAQIVAKENDFLDGLAAKLVTMEDDGAVAIADSDSEVLSSRAAIIAMKMAGIECDYEQKHVEIINSLAKMQAGCGADLICGKRAVRGYGQTLIINKTQKTEFCFPFGVGKFKVGAGTLDVSYVTFPSAADKAFFAKERDNGVLYISAERDYSGVEIRPRRAGDVIAKIGGGSVKVKEMLIDKKIERHLRDALPVIARESEVIAVCGVEVSGKYLAGAGGAYRVEWKK